MLSFEVTACRWFALLGALGRPAAEASHFGDRLERIKALPKCSPKKEAKRKKKAGLGDEDSLSVAAIARWRRGAILQSFIRLQ